MTQIINLNYIVLKNTQEISTKNYDFVCSRFI